jgi:citrate synthase
MPRLVDSATAARRLGVKRETLYAYVSRGLLESHRADDGRSSLFDLEEVERLAQRARGARAVETRLQTVTTAVTELAADGPRYRGRSAIELVRICGFEEVAELLWGSRVEQWEPEEINIPSWVPLDRDRIRIAVVLAGATDPLRADRRPDAVARAARRLISSVVACLPASEPGPRGPGTAHGLAFRLGAAQPSAAFERALDAALVLLADHELAVSSVAVRVAASTHASVYDAMLAGLGCNGPLHVGASELAFGLVERATEVGAATAIDEALRWGGAIPGFGHAIYTDVDPRFAALVPYLEEVSVDTAETLAALVAVASDHHLPAPNVDLMLGALCVAAGARRDGGVTIFTVARLAGWVAHYLEELDEKPLRFRARAIYATRSEAGATT